MKRLSIEEENSGFELKKLSLKIVANNQKMSIENFAIDLPNTSLAMDTIRMEYDSLGAFRNFTNDVRFSLRIFPSDITLCDLTPFVPAFFPFIMSVFFRSVYATCVTGVSGSGKKFAGEWDPL